MNEKQEHLFDEYSSNYHQSLNDTLSATGEETIFFANERVKWLKQKIDKLYPGYKINNILDYGCGTGDTVPIIDVVFSPLNLTGIDISKKSIEVAKINHQTNRISFYCTEEMPENLVCELAYCNGVFHHIPIEERNNAATTVYSSLSVKGIWAFWENNPWNPGTQYLMHKCPFDKDAISLSVIESKRLLKENGFKIVDVSFCFIFPRALKFLRFSEKFISSLPIGAQYLILAQKD
jgi:SAM-dependent methyltransferase